MKECGLSNWCERIKHRSVIQNVNLSKFKGVFMIFSCCCCWKNQFIRVICLWIGHHSVYCFLLSATNTHARSNEMISDFFDSFKIILVAVFLWEASDNKSHKSKFPSRAQSPLQCVRHMIHWFRRSEWSTHRRTHVIIPLPFLRKLTQHSGGHHTPQKAHRLCSTRTVPTRGCVCMCVRMSRALTSSGNHGNRVMIAPCPPIHISLAFTSSR